MSYRELCIVCNPVAPLYPISSSIVGYNMADYAALHKPHSVSSAQTKEPRSSPTWEHPPDKASLYPCLPGGCCSSPLGEQQCDGGYLCPPARPPYDQQGYWCQVGLVPPPHFNNCSGLPFNSSDQCDRLAILNDVNGNNSSTSSCRFFNESFRSVFSERLVASQLPASVTSLCGQLPQIALQMSSHRYPIKSLVSMPLTAAVHTTYPPNRVKSTQLTERGQFRIYQSPSPPGLSVQVRKLTFTNLNHRPLQF